MARNKNKTVLVVDDEADVRELARRILELEGYIVRQAADGQECLDALNSQEGAGIGLVLLDLKMPRIDGFAVLERLRNEPGLKHLPVVVFSAFAGSEQKEKALNCGADVFLVKPLSAREIASAAKKLL